MEEPGADKLERLLLDAEAAHAKYEKERGSKDKDWARWYADYVLKRLREDN